MKRRKEKVRYNDVPKSKESIFTGDKRPREFKKRERHQVQKEGRFNWGEQETSEVSGGAAENLGNKEQPKREHVRLNKVQK